MFNRSVAQSATRYLRKKYHSEVVFGFKRKVESNYTGRLLGS